MCGKRITSRIDAESVRSITNASIPMPLTRRWRHAVFQSFYVVFVHKMGFAVTGVPVLHLLEEPAHLVFRVVEFGKAIGNFTPRDEKLKSIRQVRVDFTPPGKRGYLHRIAGDKCRLDEFWLHPAHRTVL